MSRRRSNVEILERKSELAIERKATKASMTIEEIVAESSPRLVAYINDQLQLGHLMDPKGTELLNPAIEIYLNEVTETYLANLGRSERRACIDAVYGHVSRIVLNRVDQIFADCIRQKYVTDEVLGAAENIKKFHPNLLREHKDAWFEFANIAIAKGLDTAPGFAKVAGFYGLGATLIDAKDGSSVEVSGEEYTKAQVLIASKKLGKEKHKENPEVALRREALKTYSELVFGEAPDIRIAPNRQGRVISALETVSKKAIKTATATRKSTVATATALSFIASISSAAPQQDSVVRQLILENRTTDIPFAVNDGSMAAGAIGVAGITESFANYQAAVSTEAIAPTLGGVDLAPMEAQEASIMSMSSRTIVPDRALEPQTVTIAGAGELPESAIFSEGATATDKIDSLAKLGDRAAAISLIKESFSGGEIIDTKASTELWNLYQNFVDRIDNSSLEPSVRAELNAKLAYFAAGINNPSIFDTMSSEIRSSAVDVPGDMQGADLVGSQAALFVDLFNVEDYGNFEGYSASQQGAIAGLAAQIALRMMPSSELQQLDPTIDPDTIFTRPSDPEAPVEAASVPTEIQPATDLDIKAAELLASSEYTSEFLESHFKNHNIDPKVWWSYVSFIMKDFTANGWAAHHIAGNVGNFAVEAPGLDPAIHQFSGGPGRGWAQWEEAHSKGGGRANALYAFAEALGIPWDSKEAQAAFVRHEYSGTEARAYGLLLNTDSASEAAYVVGKYYERPADLDASLAARQEFADIVFDEYMRIYNELKAQDELRVERARQDAEALGNWNPSAMINGEAAIESLKSEYGDVSGNLRDDQLELVGERWGNARLAKEPAAGFRALNAAFKAQFGHDILFTSSVDAYRSYEIQYNAKNDPKNAHKKHLLATPGKSNHGWGYAGDLQLSAEEYQWMIANAQRFGWENPRWAWDETSPYFKYEPWHFEFNGISSELRDGKTIGTLLAEEAEAARIAEEARIAAEQEAARQAEEAAKNPVLPFDPGTYRITSGFGDPRGSGRHNGIDLASELPQAPIRAIASGVITIAEYGERGRNTHWNSGNVIYIEHDGGWATGYAHMARYADGIGVGTHVKAGDIIGYEGNTGFSDGEHLHITVESNHKEMIQVEPIEFLRSKGLDIVAGAK